MGALRRWTTSMGALRRWTTSLGALRRWTTSLGALRRWGALVVLGVGSWACSDPWLVVKQGDEAAFKGKKSFMFDAPSLGDMVVDGGSEEQYVATGDDLVELWQRGKATFLERFPAALTARLGEKGLSIGPGPTIVARVEDVVVGELYTVDDNPNFLQTKITMVVSLSEGGTTSDQVRVEGAAHGFATKPVELRFGAVGDHLGRLAADFVASRVE